MVNLNPVPSFPPYSGPYEVGTVDVEIPVSSLESPSPAPDASIGTIAFRIFYPCEKPSSHERPVRWVPSPQRQMMAAFTRFLGVGSTLSEALSYAPSLMYYVTIPAHRNAPLRAPSAGKRWPVMVFSHGLGGSRNAYSHVCGSMASHGVVVFAPDHRDGSSPLQVVKGTKDTPARTVDYRRYSHKPSPEVYEGRDEQLRVRLWEMGLLHDALGKLEAGDKVDNLKGARHHHVSDKVSKVLSQFRHSIEVHTPGQIAYAGHSFGAATTVQFVKSIYYASSNSHASATPPSSYRPLFTPSANSPLLSQIIPNTPVTLLDMWALPLRSPSTRWLWEQPMPCYHSSSSSSTPSGAAPLLAILSEGFYKWTGNLHDSLRVLSPPSTSTSSTSSLKPRIFYPISSAHLSQSDFGVLFPWATKKIFGAMDPERTLKLNVRAMLQLLREAGIGVAETSRADMELPPASSSSSPRVSSSSISNEKLPPSQEKIHDGSEGDEMIFSTEEGAVRGWVYVDLAKQDLPDEEEEGMERAREEERREGKMGPEDAVLDGEVLSEVRKGSGRG